MNWNKEIFNSTLFLKVISIVMALLLWMYVAQGQNPTEDKLFEVGVNFVNLPEDLAVSQSSTVKVRVEGSKQVIDDLLARDIEATVDMSDANIGRHAAKINITLPDRVQLVSVNPIDLLVDVQRVEQTQKDVTVLFGNNTNALNQEYTVVTPAEVQISGPQDTIKLIDKVYVRVQEDEITADYKKSLPVQVEDAQGNRLNSLLEIDPADVEVYSPYLSGEPTKTVAVDVPITGEPASGYAITRVTVNPSTAVLEGSYSALNGIASVRTVAVDVSGAKGNVTAKPLLTATEGVKVLSGEAVDVVVVIESLIQRTFNDVPVAIKNQNAEHAYQLSRDTVNVTIEGPKSVIENMTVSDVVPYCDVSQLQNGVYPLDIQFDSNGELRLVSLSQQEATVTIASK